MDVTKKDTGTVEKGNSHVSDKVIMVTKLSWRILFVTEFRCWWWKQVILVDFNSLIVENNQFAQHRVRFDSQTRTKLGNNLVYFGHIFNLLMMLRFKMTFIWLLFFTFTRLTFFWHSDTVKLCILYNPFVVCKNQSDVNQIING